MAAANFHRHELEPTSKFAHINVRGLITVI